MRDNRKIDRDPPLGAGAAATAEADGPTGPSADAAEVPDTTEVPDTAGVADTAGIPDAGIPDTTEVPDTAENTVAANEDPAAAVVGASDTPEANETPTVPLEDLQRLSAEYTNYRRRAERERLAAGEHAVGRVLVELLPVIDDLDRARVHDDLTGPLKAVADKLDAVFAKLEVEPFGEVGDPFDPNRHEAVLHDESDEVSVPTCTTVMRRGYALHDRVLRAAMVGVSDPAVPTAVTNGAGDEPSASSDKQ